MDLHDPRVYDLYKEYLHSADRIPVAVLYARISELVLTKRDSVLLMEDQHSISPKTMPHNHSFYEILFIEEGTISYQINSDIYSVKKGDIIILPPQIIHRPIYTDTGDNTYRRIVLWFSSEYLKMETEVHPELNYIFDCCQSSNCYIWHPPYQSCNSLFSVMNLLLKNTSEDDFTGHSLQAYGCMTLLSLMNNYYHAERQKCMDKPNRITDGMLAYTQSHLHEKITLEDIANHFCVSKQTVSNHFRNHIRISFYEYVTQMRLLEIQNKILSGVPVTKAWIGSGFSEYSVFYKAFRKNYGISPAEFVKLQKAASD